MPAEQASNGDVRALVAELLNAVRDQAGQPLPLLMSAEQAWAFLGLSKAGFYRLVSAGELPPPVNLPGSNPRWKRSDLERWAEKLKPKR